MFATVSHTLFFIFLSHSRDYLRAGPPQSAATFLFGVLKALGVQHTQLHFLGLVQFGFERQVMEEKW